MSSVKSLWLLLIVIVMTRMTTRDGLLVVVVSGAVPFSLHFPRKKTDRWAIDLCCRRGRLAARPDGIAATEGDDRNGGRHYKKKRWHSAACVCVYTVRRDGGSFGGNGKIRPCKLILQTALQTIMSIVQSCPSSVALPLDALSAGGI